MIKTIIAVAAIIASPVAAQERRIIWNDVYAGMTAAELRAAHPQRIPDPNRPGRMMRHATYWGGDDTEIEGFDIIEGCQGKAMVSHPRNGVVTSVTVSSRWGCDDHRIFAAMVAKYGEPSQTEMRKNDIDLIGGGSLPRTSREALWIMDGRTVRQLGNEVTYQVTPPSSNL